MASAWHDSDGKLVTPQRGFKECARSPAPSQRAHPPPRQVLTCGLHPLAIRPEQPPQKKEQRPGIVERVRAELQGVDNPRRAKYEEACREEARLKAQGYHSVVVEHGVQQRHDKIARARTLSAVC